MIILTPGRPHLQAVTRTGITITNQHHSSQSQSRRLLPRLPLLITTTLTMTSTVTITIAMRIWLQGGRWEFRQLHGVADNCQLAFKKEQGVIIVTLYEM